MANPRYIAGQAEEGGEEEKEEEDEEEEEGEEEEEEKEEEEDEEEEEEKEEKEKKKKKEEEEEGYREGWRVWGLLTLGLAKEQHILLQRRETLPLVPQVLPFTTDVTGKSREKD